VSLLKERLLATGDLTSSAALTAPELYDTTIEEGVRRFQERMGLAVDGAVGARTREELNVALTDRILQLRINLDRGRVLLHDLPPQFVIVNVAAYWAYVVRNDEVIWRSRVQVGTPYRRTPIFRSAITYLVWNPTWTVPPGILRRDILPDARGDPRSITRRGLVVLDRNGKAVDPATIDWSQYRSGHIPYTLRQAPGPHNAMGRVKFMFPNSYAVYLHDTPSKSRFDAPDRSFSSGCVRVERPFELAMLLLNDPERWNEASIARTIESGRTQNVTLRNQVPVLLAYWTAWPDPAGRTNFRRDVYGQDAQWAAGLDGPFRIRRRPLTTVSWDMANNH
jgi:murein L,D-transpeptidase YcbB/YkuD